MAAVNAFWNPPAGSASIESANQRQTRYDWYWKLAWNTAYDNLTAYVGVYPSGAKLYKYTRGLRNPLARWVDFYVANIWGGILDMAAGNGHGTASALPIECEDERLRPAIARLWTWSNWNGKRALLTRYSTSLGDAFIKVIDRPEKRRCYLQALYPGFVTECQWDDFGNVKRVAIEYQATDDFGKSYTYKELIEHPSVWGGTRTRFSTYRDGRPNSFDGQLPQWEVPYDFVPVVHIPWLDTGQNWGAVGFTATLKKIDAANALASQLADQVGKAVNTPLVAYGIEQGNVTIAQSQDGVPIMYINKPPSEADVKPLISDLNLEHGLKVLEGQLEEVKNDMPELRLSEALRSGMSGEAIGRAFSDVIAQIQAVRAHHDAGLVRAHMMGVAIAGASGYHAAFQGYDLSSYGTGALDHAIGARPVLPQSSEEVDEALKRRWEMVGQAVTADVPLETALRNILGWDDAKLADMGTARLAAIALQQEDAVDGIAQ